MTHFARHLTRRPAFVIVALCGMLATASCLRDAQGDETVAQGWTEKNRFDWYWATQGSRLMPEDWFTALERADSAEPFSDVSYLTSFGFVAPPAGSDTDRPVGFAIDSQADAIFVNSGLRWYEGQQGGETTAERWIGLNCAACHTARISYEGRDMIVDGGPSLLDFQSFIEALDQALETTRSETGKWERFNAAVLEGKDTAANRALLASAYDDLLEWQRKTDAMNETPVRYGYGRLDAVGHIFNKILMFAGADVQDGNPANAPVSYPFIWDIWRQDRVQWNGVASNSRLNLPGDTLEYGALGRNAGEVMGVFGEVLMIPQTSASDALKGYHSSVRTNNLMRLEQVLQTLDAPDWPAVFPEIDTDLAATGEGLFRDRCANCHLLPDMQQEGAPTERMVSFRDTSAQDLTDIWMACNAFVREGPSGPLNGTRDNNGTLIGATAPVANLLGATVKNAMIGAKGDIVADAIPTFFGIRKRPVVEALPLDPRAADRMRCMTEPDVLILGYKARPLDGIWATAPYLHNGSVPNLYELLLPASERSTSFTVGNHEYDPVNVGYVTTGGGFTLETRDGTGVIEGNSNAGHEYGAQGFTEEQRRALVEFMKSL
ncbi:di-heme-cytochrome C peroxidase [Marivita sp. S2033]|uniref:di-heme-cytochrome C peroxidase n=1 Tax=Marivita sp. S2033 TaxID=3373187 RepID=UPI0039825C2F